MKKNSLIKQAEQNALNQTKLCMDTLNMIDTLRTFTNKYLPAYHHDRTQRASKALTEFRNCIYDQFVENMSRCFLFVGVGGEESEKFSRDMFKEWLGDERLCVMQYLDQFGHLPSSWENDTEKQFRKEIKEVIKNELSEE